MSIPSTHSLDYSQFNGCLKSNNYITPRDSITVLSDARTTFENQDISNELVKIGNKLEIVPEGINCYSVGAMDKMLNRASVVIDTSMAIAIAGILSDRGNATNNKASLNTVA